LPTIWFIAPEAITESVQGLLALIGRAVIKPTDRNKDPILLLPHSFTRGEIVFRVIAGLV
jgi:hypothetical protein